MFEKVLVCLDGSPAAARVLPSITGDVRQLKSTLVLLRVVTPPASVVPIGIPGEPAIPLRSDAALERFPAERAQAAAYLDGIAAPLREAGMSVECAVVPGVPGEIICHYAEENGISVIAIASHGHGGLRRLAIGSTADYVLHHATQPVLIVKPVH